MGCGRPRSPADIIICNGAEPKSLDPVVVTGQADMRVVGTLFEGLTRLNPITATPEPGLAQRWDISEDGTVYTFYVRPEAVWSTGQAITAHDVVHSWRRLIDPATAADYASQLFFVKNARELHMGRQRNLEALGVRALDDRTVRVELISPVAFFLDLCALRSLAVVPIHTIRTHGFGWVRADPLPVNGPYQLEFWRVQDRVRVRKNPRYWDARSVRNETVDFLPIENANTALNLYERRQADIILDKTLIPTELSDALRVRSDCHPFDFLGTVMVRFNTTRPPFNDARVRRALTMAIDKQRLVDKIVRGGERPAGSFTPPGVARYQPPGGLAHDPEQARRWLAEAGYPSGRGFPTFSYLFNSSRLNEQIGVELQEMWARELGLHVELRQTEFKVWLTSQRALDYDTCRGSWVGDYNDANTFLDVFLSDNNNNRTGWKNPHYDQLIRTANGLLDSTRRAELFHQAETILVKDELPLAPLYFYKGMNMFRPDELDGIHENILDEHPVWAIARRRGRGTV